MECVRLFFSFSVGILDQMTCRVCLPGILRNKYPANRNHLFVSKQVFYFLSYCAFSISNHYWTENPFLSIPKSPTLTPAEALHLVRFTDKSFYFVCFLLPVLGPSPTKLSCTTCMIAYLLLCTTFHSCTSTTSHTTQ